MSAFASLGPVLRVACWQRDPDSPWAGRLLVAGLALAFVIGLALIPEGVPRRIFVGCVAGGALIGLWLAVVGSLLDQNHPNAARLVPGHARRLRDALLLAWGLCAPLLAVSLDLALVGLGSPLLMLLIAASVLVFSAWASRQWMLWMLFWIVPALSGLLRSRLQPLAEAVRELWSQHAPALTGLALLGLAMLLLALFGQGDAAHQSRHARRSRMRQAAQSGLAGHRSGLAMLGRPGEWLARPFDRAGAAWLAHVLAQARPERRSVMARLEIALHGAQHWVRQAVALGVAIGLVGLGLGMAFVWAGGDVHRAWQSGAAGMAVGIASAGINPVFALRSMLWHTRREQALLRLLPAVPQGRPLNRALAFLQLRHFGVAWSLTLLATAWLAWAADMSAVLCIPAAALPVGVVSLTRSPARMRRPASWSAVLPVFGFLLLGGVLYGLQAGLAWRAAWLVAACVALSLALLSWRWRAVGRAPVALPAGRLA